MTAPWPNWPTPWPERLPADAPARYAARRMARLLGVVAIENAYSAELIDVTRSLRHRGVMPAAVRRWPAALRQRLIEEVHTAHRTRVQRAIQERIQQDGHAIHISLRSFPLRGNGVLRRTDIGLLYDPARGEELDFCLDWIDEMYDVIPMVRVRRNYPRRGTTESLVTAMRHRFAGDRYLGVELWLNRAWAARRIAQRDRVIEGICDSLYELLEIPEAEAA